MQSTQPINHEPVSGADPVRTIYRFDNFRFSTVPLQLHFDDEIVEARPQSLRLLEILLESIGQVVSTQTVVRRLWPNGNGNERVLRVTMAHLRSALDRAGDATLFVETVRSQGYRFVHPVEIKQQQLVHRHDSSSRRSWFGA